MKKRLFLFFLTMCNISLLQAADVGDVTHAFSTGVQVEIVGEEVEESYDGKGKGKAQKQRFAHIRRDGDELVDPFSVDLLNNSNVLKNIIERGENWKDFSLEKCIENFLEDYNDEQIKLLINALRHNKEERATSFVRGCLVKNNAASLMQLPL